jgi:hypothetical protein
VVNLEPWEVRDLDHPGALPAVPSTLQEVVDLVAAAVVRPAAEVAFVLRGVMPRLSHRRSMLWLTAEAAAAAVRFLRGPSWWHRSRVQLFLDDEPDVAPWRHLADDTAGGVARVEHVYGALGQDLAAAWWPGPVDWYDPNAPWSIRVPSGLAAGDRFAADAGEGGRIWCHADLGDDGRLVARRSGLAHPPGPYERLWPRGQSPYFTLGFGPHLFPGEQTGDGDAAAFAAARDRIAGILPHVREQAARFSPETLAALEQAAVAMRDIAAACAAEVALREVVSHGGHPLAGHALHAETSLHAAVDGCLISPRA